MKNSMDGKAIALELCRTWQTLLDQENLSPEVAYRIHKMIQRIIPIVDKVYLKTLKGREMILQYAEKTKALQDYLNSNEEYLYYLLTDLEKTYEDLLKKY